MSQQQPPSMVLFTPGPLQTSPKVKQAMLSDYGSRDATFIGAVAWIRKTMLQIARVDEKAWTCVPLQGPGTFTIEAAISTTTPRGDAGHYLVIRTGKYAERQEVCSKRIGIRTTCFEVKEGEDVDLVALEGFLQAKGSEFSNVGMVHHETSTGMVNPVAEIAKLVRRYCRPSTTIIIDSISAFGGIPIDLEACCDVLLTSSNKCFHGVPGFGLVMMRRALMTTCKGWSRSFALDLCSQNAGLDKNGQFPFTPPVHTLMAFRVAVEDFLAQGGIEGRIRRYADYSRRVQQQMLALGFSLFLDPSRPSFGHIVVAFNMPKHPKWNFKAFYEHLRKRGCVIYPGKASNAETFRFGLIGDIQSEDIDRILAASTEFVRDPKNGITDLKAHPFHNQDLSWRSGSNAPRTAKL